MGEKRQEPLDFNIRPAGDYLDSLADFADLLGSIHGTQKITEEKLEKSADDQVAAETAVPVPENEPDLDTLLAQLDALVGLEKIKTNVHSLINLVKVRKMRQENGLVVPPVSLHLVFMGNPGTGKTTVARLIAQLYHAVGVLSKGQLVEVDRSGLVAGYVGQTAVKTAEVIQKAMGGVLFIDEAYALTAKDNANDFGHEAVETILKAMEDHRDDFVVIVAGYEMLMEQFISSNPGLESRFNRYFIFEDYNGDELFEIFKGFCDRNEYLLADDAERAVRIYLNEMYAQRDQNFGNGRDVRNLFENVIAVHSDRVSELEAPTKNDLMTILPTDIQQAILM
jgi:SpoVK/Ycf46/Vps4 family AAA+-type ATPase